MENEPAYEQIGGAVWKGSPRALEQLKAAVRREERRKALVETDHQLEAALAGVAEFLQSNWETDAGFHLRHFVWSLWNGHQMVNLYNLANRLDSVQREQAVAIFSGLCRNTLREEHLQNLLERSGEFARWKQTCAQTPDGQPVEYPPVGVGRGIGMSTG